MTENPQQLDLDLWLDRDIIPRQNKLKKTFWELLSNIANTVNTEELREIHSGSRGAKLSKGNDLLGYPYQVLDLVRDFDMADGLNIRLLNWFGHGLFLFVLIGKNHAMSSCQPFIATNWAFDLSSSPYDYAEILLNHRSTTSVSSELIHKSAFCQWHKPLKIFTNPLTTQKNISDELKNLLSLLPKKMG